jgi:dTDP-4-amino-4,6-dideoxygalactose transaminase
MDEIRAALAGSLLDRLPDRLALHRRNYEYAAERLTALAGIALRRPVAPGAYLGEALVFRLPDADPRRCARFARALTAEGIDARALGDPADANVRTFWNWRFLFGRDAAAARAALPKTARYVGQAIDVPLSANLTLEDCDDLVTAVRKVLANLR